MRTIKRALILWGFLSASLCLAESPEGLRIETVIEGVRVPWSMAWLPDGNMLVTERSGELYRVSDGQLIAIEGLPQIHANGQGGLLDIALHPQYGSNGWLYLSYASLDGAGEGSHTAVMRARLQDDKLVDTEVLYKGDGNSTRGQHYGGRIAFDSAGYLFFSIGERGAHFENAQQLDRDGGKIYRLHDDGRVPEDNPFVGVTGAKEAIFSYGHRNPQGLALNPVTGEMWSHEHGPMGGDEVNVIRAGLNYGWPIIGYGINYDGNPLAIATHRDDIEQPVHYWDPSIAPSGMVFVTSDIYGTDFQGHLLIGSMKFRHMVDLTLNGNTVLSHENVFPRIGRVRDIRQGPDGYLYVATEGNGILRILPPLN